MSKMSFGFGVLSAIIGLVVLLHPAATETMLVFVLGLGAVVNGLYDALSVRFLSTRSAFRRTVLVRSVVSVAVGVVAIFFPLQTANALMSFCFALLGVYLLLFAAAEFFLIYQLHDSGMSVGTFWIEAFGAVVLAVLLFLIPSRIGHGLIRLLGLLLFLGGAAYAVYALRRQPLVLEPDEVRDAEDEE